MLKLIFERNFLSEGKNLFLVLIFFIWRFVLLIPLIIGFFFIPYRYNYDFTQVFNEVGSISLAETILLKPWANFDGVHYLTIAGNGYTNQARFFPLFPILINGTTNIFGVVATFSSAQVFISVILASFIFFLSLLFFKKIIELDFPKDISKKSIIYLLLFPTSFFFVCVYSESLFLLLTLLSFYLARKGNWWLVCFCAMLLTTTRFVGIAILPALVYEMSLSTQLSRYRKELLILIIPLGLILYSAFNYYQWNDPLYFIKAQGELGNSRSVDSIVLFPQTIFRYIKILLALPINSYDWRIAVMELTSFISISLLLYLTWKKKIRRSYFIFALTTFAIATSTGTFSGLPRYVIVLFPIFITLALEKNIYAKILYLIFAPLLQFILVMFFSRGYFIA